MTPLLLAACGGRGADGEVETGGPSGGELPYGHVVAGDGMGWLVEDQGLSEGELIDDPEPHRVYRIQPNGRTEPLPPLSPPGIFHTRGSGDRLVVAGARCADGTLQQECATIAEVAVLEPGATEWRRVEIARGEGLQELAFNIVRSDDDRIRLVSDYDETGRRDGGFHVIELDPGITRIQDWSPISPGTGGYCAIDGVVYSYTMSGGSMTPTEPGVDPDVFAPVPVSYQFYAYERGAWRPADNGAFSGERAWVENMGCTDDSFVARVADGSTGFLRWTPSGGWVEEPPPAPADRISLQPVDGHMVGIRDGQIVLEHAPGDLRPLPGVPGPRTPPPPSSGPPVLPALDVSPTSVAACDLVLHGEATEGTSGTRLRNCTVVDRP